jgi:hypothetical protein
MFNKNKIWAATLANQNDTNDSNRSRLRACFETFRSRIEQFIQTIPAEIPGLTVHDISHLDALWEMAELLVGGDYEINPAEAFVLGGSILLHDSAMTICAYEGGVEEIKRMVEYSDVVAQLTTASKISNDSVLDPKAIETLAISEVLRIKHASKAEELASQAWVSPLDGSKVMLIEDTELRDHYSNCIGRIANSHHWDITDLPKKLSTSLGAFSGFPTKWTVNQIKIALILRCIDAMHIDDRRAPKFLSAIRSIGAVSLQHWRFQNLLTQPHVEDERLIYTSKRPFKVSESAAWNLCFDTVQMIDSELRNARDLQLQKKIPEFKVFGVAGANSPESLSKFIEVDGWQPLPLNLKVSNVSHLAQTLGGKDLYDTELAPLREMIQNSADAVEARVALDTEFELSDGQINIKLQHLDSEEILLIQDNGVGMSEFVLTNALLDFGFSFWKSAQARIEFPGLQSSVHKLRGRYGIGFFSIFMWSEEVIVSSRRFNDGVNSSQVLEFRQGLETRPLLRPAASKEKSSKWTTQIQIKLKKGFLKKTLINRTSVQKMRFTRSQYGLSMLENTEEYEPSFLVKKIKTLCATLPIKVKLEIDSVTSTVSLPDWKTCEPSRFLEFFDFLSINEREKNIRFAKTLSQLNSPEIGRCFITPYDTGNSVMVYEKGIFIGINRVPNIGGVVESITLNAARDRFEYIAVHKDEVWLKETRAKAFAACKNFAEELAVQGLFHKLEKPDFNRPLFIKNRELISWNELKVIAVEQGFFNIRLVEEGRDKTFKWKAATTLHVLHGLKVDEDRVYPLFDFEGTCNAHEDLEIAMLKTDNQLLSFINTIMVEIGPNASINTEYTEKNGYKDDYVDVSFKSGNIQKLN